MTKLNYKHTIIACYLASVTQAAVVNLSPLLFLIFSESFGISLSKITLIITVNFLTQFMVDFLSAHFVEKIGHRKCIVAAHIFSATGIAAMAILPFAMPSAFAGLLVSSMIYAIGGGLIEVMISPLVEACPTDNKTGAMSLLHSFYCWGTVVVILFSTIFLYVFGRESWRILTFLWTILPVCNAVFFARVPILTLTEEGEGMSVGELFRNRLFLVFIILMISAGASEQAMSQWASAFAEKGLGISKTAGDIIGACMFSVMMGIMRTLYAKVSDKADLKMFISGSALLCVIAYLIASLSQNSLVSLAGCILCGLSVGIMWPGVCSLAAKNCPTGGTAMFAMLALAGDLGCTTGPTLVGFISDAFGDNLKMGLLFAIIFPVMMIMGCIGLKKIVNRSCA